METTININELDQAGRLNSRLNICMSAYNEKTKGLHKLNVHAYRKFKTILATTPLMVKLTPAKLQLVKDTMTAFKPVKESFENSELLKETVTCTIEQYVTNFERDAVMFVREISGILAEIWLIVGMAEEIDDGIQEFMDIAFTGAEYGMFKTILDELDVKVVDELKDTYIVNPKLALDLLRDRVNEQVKSRNVFNEVNETIGIVEKEVEEEMKEIKEKVEEKMNTEKETQEEFKNKDVKTDKDIKHDKYKKYLKYAAIAVAGLAVGYAGKKIYDNCTSDDIIIIDTDGIDNLDLMSSSCNVSLF